MKPSQPTWTYLHSTPSEKLTLEESWRALFQLSWIWFRLCLQTQINFRVRVGTWAEFLSCFKGITRNCLRSADAADGALKTKTLLTCSYASMTNILSKWAIPAWPATGHSAANRADSLWAWIQGTSTISLKATLKWTMYEMNLYVHIHLFMCSNLIFLWRKKHYQDSLGTHWFFHVHCTLW
jgi:hypothetical protein